MNPNRQEMSSFSDDYLDDSFASVGNSTRSLLSPILNEKLQIRSSTPDEKDTECEDDHEKDYNDPERSKNMVLTSISMSNRRNSDSYRTSSNCSFVTSSGFGDTVKGNKCQLSPWEKWLLRKTQKERENMEEKKMKESRKKLELIEKERKKREKRKEIEEKLEKWKAEKDLQDKEVRRKKREEREKIICLEEEKQNVIEEKSSVVYKKWLQDKKIAELQKIKKMEEEQQKKKEKEVEKRMKSEQAFEEWLKKTRNNSNHDCSFGCTSSVVKCHYDWASYPTPSYVNPMPWVTPVSKRHRERQQWKKELQPVSPPLLFKEYEKRNNKSSTYM